MPEKFDPSPKDKHAESDKRTEAERKTDEALEKGLKDSFPASDPPSQTQPTKKLGDDE
jgi:hypothetical protein